MIAYTDGASRGNPGDGGTAWILLSNKDTLLAHAFGVKKQTTNNQAEYEALVQLTEWVLDNLTLASDNELVIRSDSMLVVRQLSGLNKCENPNIIEQFMQVKQNLKTLTDFGVTVVLEHVERGQNKAADMLVNHAMDHKLEYQVYLTRDGIGSRARGFYLNNDKVKHKPTESHTFI